MNKSAFKILGIRTIQPKHANNYYQIDRVKKMQKRLFYYEDWLYFYHGVNFKEDVITVSRNINDDSILYDAPNMAISLSAIVGKNGAGKSTILDMVIRILNNVGASIIGEYRVYSSAEHLHYVDYLYADLLVMQGDTLTLIKSRDFSLKVITYKKDNIQHAENLFFKQDGNPIELIDDDERTYESPKKAKPHLRYILGNLFYTCIFNYSIYAYNYRDYYSEITNPNRLEEILGKNDYNKLAVSSQERFWHTGLFHKNDGYQTPIVLNPMRDDGLLNGPEENELAADRLLSMMFYKDNTGNYPFRDINKSLIVVGLFIPPSDGDYRKEFVLSELGIAEKTNLYENYDNISKDIRTYFKNQANGAIKDKRAYNYLVYKTIKIFRRYKKYGTARYWLNQKEYNPQKIKECLDALMHDESHITAKIRRTMNYLLSDMYDSPERGIADFFMLDAKTEAALKELRVIFPNATCSDLVPPPIFDTTFRIRMKGNTANVQYKQTDIISFEGLSAGERQLTYTISNFVYHLVNVDSVWKRDDNDDDETPDIRYRYINAIFDEVELYFHPDMQRRFVSYLIHALQNISLSHIEGVNIILVTHSPFIISDIPASNIISLKLPDDRSADLGETFCSNIYDMLSKNFFMDYSIGQLAQEKVSAFFERQRTFREKECEKLDKDDIREYSYLVEHIGDQYIKRKAQQALIEMSEEVGRRQDLERELESINKRREQIENELRNLDRHEEDRV